MTDTLIARSVASVSHSAVVADFIHVAKVRHDVSLVQGP